MALLPGSTAQESPAAVPIHIDRDMESVSASAHLLGVPDWFRLFGVPPSRIHATSCHKSISRKTGLAAASLEGITLQYKVITVNPGSARTCRRDKMTVKQDARRFQDYATPILRGL